MDDEVERKFLVGDRAILKDPVSIEEIMQSYPLLGAHYALRIRVASGGATLNIKSRAPAMVREEWQRELPLPMAMDLLHASFELIHKTRYSVVDSGVTWSVDEFHDRNSGLLIAEAELSNNSSANELAMPSWCTQEVTLDHRYYNEALARRPIDSWPEAERPRVI